MAQETYKGPGEYAAAYGQSSVDSAIGTAVGAGGAVGATAIGLAVNKEATLKFMQKTPLIGRSIKGSGMAMITAALGVGLVAGAVTSVTGWFRGAQKANDGAEQFYRMQNERDMALAKVNGLETQIEQMEQRFTDKHKPRSAEGSFADAVLADKAQSSEVKR